MANCIVCRKPISDLYSFTTCSACSIAEVNKACEDWRTERLVESRARIADMIARKASEKANDE